MTSLPTSIFANPVWHALQTKHKHFAMTVGKACRYPADVAPFVAVGVPTRAALQQLASLIVHGEHLWLFDDNFPPAPEIDWLQTLQCLQMVLPSEVNPPDPTAELIPLRASDGADMVALTTLAFPGFFRNRTYRMGSYFGIRHQGELIAMGGERIMLDGYPEISGVCTHPSHRGKGYAAAIIWELVRNHRRRGETSWLHVAASNQNAIDLYSRLGFVASQIVTLHRISLKT
jgi:GNAT superfamily N-acetyltransferase